MHSDTFWTVVFIHFYYPAQPLLNTYSNCISTVWSADLLHVYQVKTAVKDGGGFQLKWEGGSFLNLCPLSCQPQYFFIFFGGGGRTGRAHIWLWTAHSLPAPPSPAPCSSQKGGRWNIQRGLSVHNVPPLVGCVGRRAVGTLHCSREDNLAGHRAERAALSSALLHFGPVINL